MKGPQRHSFFYGSFPQFLFCPGAEGSLGTSFPPDSRGWAPSINVTWFWFLVKKKRKESGCAWKELQTELSLERPVFAGHRPGFKTWHRHSCYSPKLSNPWQSYFGRDQLVLCLAHSRYLLSTFLFSSSFWIENKTKTTYIFLNKTKPNQN